MSKIFSDGELREMTVAEKATLSVIQVETQLFRNSFIPIEPVPFWKAAWDLLSLKKSDIYAAIEDPDERYLAELDIEGRNTYRRDDPIVVKLADMLGYPANQMDALWLHVQENYR